MKRLAFATAALAASLAPAAAQTAGSPFLTDGQGTLRASKMKGAGAIGLDHARLGSVEDILIGADGRVLAVVIGVGGFLGIGEKQVAVPYAEVAWNTQGASRAVHPRGSTPPGVAGQAADTPAGGAERMPGAAVGDQVFTSVAQGRGAEVTGATGESRGTERATVPVTGPDGGIENAQLRLTRSDLERAPAFRFR
jgi:hypothetical protein